MAEARWAARFERAFAGPASAVRARIWREVFGPEYPEGVDPFSYISVTELRRFAREVRTGSGQCLVDIGCGRGGPGLWVAAATGARLVRPEWRAGPTSAGEASKTPGCQTARLTPS